MVAVLVRLKLSILRSGLRRSTWRTVAVIFGALYALGIVATLIAGQLALRFAAQEYAAPVSVLGLSAVTLGWVLAPLLLSGVDDTLDIGRLALLPLRGRHLAPGLVAAAFVGVPGVATTLAVAGQLAVWSIGIGPFLAALVAVPVGLVTAVLGSRVMVLALSGLFSSRRYREVAGVVLMLVVSAGGLIPQFFVGSRPGRAGSSAPTVADLESVAAAAAWTPVGWAWAVPADVTAGRPLTAALRLLLSVVLLGVLTLVLIRQVDLGLVSPLTAAGGGGVVHSGRGVERLLGNSPTAAVAARALRYRRRDPRQLAGVLSGVVVPAVLMLVAVTGARRGAATLAEPGGLGSVGGGGADVALILAPLVLALVFGSTVSSDLSYDGSALWMHLSSGIRGVEDRLGRAVSILVVALPVLLLVVGAGVLVTRRPGLAVSVFAAAIAMLGGGIGAGLWVGARIQVPVAPAGGNPFQQRSGGGVAGLTLAGLIMLGTVACALPAGILAILGRDDPTLAGVAAVVGVLSATGAVWAGVRAGGAHLDRKWPEVLAQVTENER